MVGRERIIRGLEVGTGMYLQKHMLFCPNYKGMLELNFLRVFFFKLTQVIL